MTTCKHLEWLRVVRAGSRKSLEFTDRLERLIQTFSDPEHTFPSLILLIGNERKRAALEQLGISGLLSKSTRTFGEARIHGSGLVASHHKDQPLFIVDADGFSTNRLGTSSTGPRCHENMTYNLPPDFQQETPIETVDRIFHNVLFPLTDLVCLFVDDLGGLAQIISRLDVWFEKGRPSTSKSSPYLFLVFDKLDISLELKLQDMLGRRIGRHPAATFSAYRIFNLSRLPPRTRTSLSLENSWLRFQNEIMNCLSSVRRSRMRAGEQFSAPHVAGFIRHAAQSLPSEVTWPLDLVKVSRTSNPVAIDLDVHLSTFLRSLQSLEDVENFAIPLIISSFILDNFPPGMHLFRPKAVFNTLYSGVCRRIFTQWSSRSDEAPNFDLPAGFMYSLEEEMTKQFVQFRKKRSAIAHHQVVLSRFSNKLDLLRSDDTCLCCLRRRPEYCLPCNHVICENCVQVFGQMPEGKPWVYLVQNCVLCKQDTNGAEFAIKPPTASVRVLSIDGGGTRGRAPLEYLQALQDQLRLPFPVQRNFDVIYGTSSGAIIAAVLFSLNWDIAECTRYFQMFARIAFKPRWWWLRIPFLSAVLQMMVSLLVDSRYSSKNLEAILQKVLGSRSIMQYSSGVATGAKLGITVTTIQDTRACVFTSYNGVGDRREDADYHVLKPRNGSSHIPLWEVVRCSTAAPYYFKPKHIQDVGTFQDGGLMFNNPASIAVREVAAFYPNAAEPSIVVSLGTGSSKASKPVTTNARHFLRDSFPARVYRAFWKSSDSKRAWQQLLDHTRLSTSSDLFRFDIEFDGRGPALDEVAGMEEIGRLAREAILESPELVRLAQRIRAELFIFELDPLFPIRFHRGILECYGYISCRLEPSTNALNIFIDQLKDNNSSFRICNRQIQLYNITESNMKRMKQFRIGVRFSVASRSEPIEIELYEGTGKGNKISGSPFTLQKLFEQQHFGACFGTANHSKKRIAADQDGRGAKKRRT